MRLDFKYIEKALLDYNAKSELKQAAIIMVRNIFEEAKKNQLVDNINYNRCCKRDSERFLEFDEWCDAFADEINRELAENGADREMDFNPESEYEKRYEMYLNAR